MNQLGIGNDQISSIRIPRGMRVVVYQDDNFRGGSKTLTGDIACLTSVKPGDWNDHISSIRVERTSGNSNNNSSRDNLQNLVGARGSSVDGEMERSGYRYVKTDKSGSDIYSYYYNSRNGKCVVVDLVNGKVASVADSAGDCNNNNSSRRDNRDNRDNLQNLVGARGSSVDGEMERSGYRYVKTDKSGSDIYSYYYNSRNGKCVVVRLVNGKVASVADSAGDCN